ncbi:MAG: hypothetical protein P4M11_12285 [Candidatus Pacebacteria bacterium]|nr:hypothetical protein [Candidatus Paceibacterota bacterium]
MQVSPDFGSRENRGARFGKIEREAPMMHAMPALIVMWAVFTALFLALLAYNATITRYEEDQLFLEDINPNEKQEQETIVRKSHALVPYIRTSGILSAILTISIIAIYTWDCWKKLQF